MGKAQPCFADVSNLAVFTFHAKHHKQPRTQIQFVPHSKHTAHPLQSPVS